MRTIGGNGYNKIDYYAIDQLVSSETLSSEDLGKYSDALCKIVTDLNKVLRRLPKELLDTEGEDGTIAEQYLCIGEKLNDLNGVIGIASDQKARIWC